MADPKKPQDHKPKKDKPKVDEREDGWRITHKGINVTVPRDALDDFELLDDLAELQKDPNRGAVRVPSMLRRLTGESGYQAVMDGLRNEKTGRVPATDAVVFVNELFGALNPNG